MVRIFLLDDDEVVRKGLRVIFETQEDMEVVGEAGTAAESLDRMPGTAPDVAILDVRLPDGDGVSVCDQARSACPDLACLMLTSFSDSDTVLAAIMAGSRGYVLKGTPPDKLISVVRAVAEGHSLLEPALTQRLLDELRYGTQIDPRLAELTETERRILDLIAEGKTNREIAVVMYLAEKTVKNYVSKLLGKLGLHHRTEAAVFLVRAERSHRSDER